MTMSTNRIQRLQEEIAQQAPRLEQGQQKTLAVLTFGLAGERYALPLSEIREVSRTGPITPIPGLPAVVLGAVGLRGEIVSVLDLCGMLGLAQHSMTAESRLVIVQHKGVKAALLVDWVEDITTLLYEELRPPPSGALEGRPPSLQGITGEGKGTTRLLDLAHLLETVLNGG